MKSTEATMKRAYGKGSTEYRLILEEHEDGRETYSIEVSQTVGENVMTASAENITSDHDIALSLTFYLFMESVDACHLTDIVEQLLPAELTLPEALISLANRMRRSVAASMI